MDKSFSLLNLGIIFLRRKKMILRHFVVVSVAAFAISLVIPKTYKATTLFLPPQSDAPSLSGLSLSMSLNIGREAAFTSPQIETLLGSRRILEATVKRFDLIHVYKTEKLPNKTEQAIKKLRQKTSLSLSTEAGFGQRVVINFSLSVVDKDRVRAAEMANFMLDELGRTMDSLSRNQYRYSEQFIHGRLDSVVTRKISVQDTLAAFQKKYKVYSPELKDQVSASIETYAGLRKQKIMAEMERDLLLFDHSPKSREATFAQKKVDEIAQKMDVIERGSRPDVLPSLDYSVDIAYRYLSLVQEAEVLTKLEILLRQQYEEARIRASRAAPMVRIVDRAVPPEWKNFPKKAFIILGIVGFYMLGLLVYILAAHGASRASEDTKARMREFREAMRFRGN